MVAQAQERESVVSVSFQRSDAILVQAACGQWQKLLHLTYPVHSQYCQRWGMDFLPLHGSLLPPNYGKREEWFNAYTIRTAYAAGYEKVIWLDADCLIVNPEVNLRVMCPANRIGAVWHEFESVEPPYYSHWNVGALGLGRGEATEAFLEAWWAEDDEGHPWSNQHAFNKASLKQFSIVEIDRKFNATEYFPSKEDPVVLHWAGTTPVMQDRYDSMALEIRRLGL